MPRRSRCGCRSSGSASPPRERPHRRRSFRSPAACRAGYRWMGCPGPGFHPSGGFYASAGVSRRIFLFFGPGAWTIEEGSRSGEAPSGGGRHGDWVQDHVLRRRLRPGPCRAGVLPRPLHPGVPARTRDRPAAAASRQVLHVVAPGRRARTGSPDKGDPACCRRRGKGGWSGGIALRGPDAVTWETTTCCGICSTTIMRPHP
jgi:hypothetical protein